MFTVEYSLQASKFLQKCDRELRKRIIDKIDKLKENPISHDSKFVAGFKEKLYRIRIGDYRVLYEVDHEGKIIGIVKIDNRSKVYS